MVGLFSLTAAKKDAQNSRSLQFLRTGENTPSVESFTKSERLALQADFKTIFTQGMRIRTEKFDIRYLLKKDGEISRLGLSVSRTVGIAVVRNTLKRITREWFRLNKHRFHRPLDVVFCLRSACSKAEVKVFQKKIEDALKPVLNL